MLRWETTSRYCVLWFPRTSSSSLDTSYRQTPHMRYQTQSFFFSLLRTTFKTFRIRFRCSRVHTYVRIRYKWYCDVLCELHNRMYTIMYTRFEAKKSMRGACPRLENARTSSDGKWSREKRTRGRQNNYGIPAVSRSIISHWGEYGYVQPPKTVRILYHWK